MQLIYIKKKSHASHAHLCKKCLKGDLSGPRVVPNGPKCI